MLKWEEIIADVADITGLAMKCERGPFTMTCRNGEYTVFFPHEPSSGLSAATLVLELGRIFAELVGQTPLERMWEGRLEKYCVELCGR